MCAALHLDALLLAELGQRLLDAQCRQAGRTVGVPALTHDLGHHPQGLWRGESPPIITTKDHPTRYYHHERPPTTDTND